MIDPRDISIQDFTYSLPESFIALQPLEQRADSRLLIYKDEAVAESVFSKLPTVLKEGSLLLLNQSKVVQARIYFQKSSGAQIECMCLEPENNRMMELALRDNGHSTWRCMIGNAKRWKAGTLKKEVIINNEILILSAERKSFDGQENSVEFTWTPSHYSFSEIMEHVGELPLPPYMHRKPEDSDIIRYNTVYAVEEGSVAAPTAGLHFTNDLLHELDLKNIHRAFITLHVGAGTFKPVQSIRMGSHEMHAERIYIRKKVLQSILLTKEKQLPVIAAGTTSLRTMESVYWWGAQLLEGRMENPFFTDQWTPYQQKSNRLPGMKEALNAVIEWMDKNNQEELTGVTKLLIVPGYTFMIADQLITNFHQPQSTLLLLVAAFVGEDWKKIYDYALRNNFRFLSYGDSSLLFKKET